MINATVPNLVRTQATDEQIACQYNWYICPIYVYDYTLANLLKETEYLHVGGTEITRGIDIEAPKMQPL